MSDTEILDVFRQLHLVSENDRLAVLNLGRAGGGHFGYPVKAPVPPAITIHRASYDGSRESQ